MLVKLDGAPSRKDGARAMRSCLGVPWTGKVGLGFLQGTSTLSPVPGSFAEGHIEKERRGEERKGDGRGEEEGRGEEGRGGEKRGEENACEYEKEYVVSMSERVLSL